MGTTSMVTDGKWWVFRAGDGHWIARAPNHTKTRHDSHTAALAHATTQQRRKAVLGALILSLLAKTQNTGTQ